MDIFEPPLKLKCNDTHGKIEFVLIDRNTLYLIRYD